MYSVNFKEIEHFQSEGAWNKAGKTLGEAARSLEKAGADFIVICTNTMHKVISDIQAMITIPILHIADATADQMNRQDIRSAGLLGTKYTMEQNFYKTRIETHGINIIVPNDNERELINNIIYQELCLGEIKQSSKNIYHTIINNLMNRGAEGIILGCTEIGLLVKAEDFKVPIFDTTLIHAREAVNKSLSISS